MKIAVFASGRGSNFSAIARAIKSGRLKAELSLLVCDQPGAGVIARAKRAKVKSCLIRRKDFASREDFERAIVKSCEAENIDVIALAGFMRMLGSVLLEKYKGRILNVHPALLPAFKGGAAIKDAFDYGAKVTGVTVHFVDDQMDHGAIVLQQALKIEEGDSLESLEAKLHKIEHKLYPQALKLFVEGKLKIEGRKVKVS